ncbi:MAG: asparagine synthase (glutamine-hydrolyzing) [Thermomicrobiales bacterium]|nr:asparagine synthase (glutamine-hydrolyzing) [Thermomicrobiales bacterium]
MCGIAGIVDPEGIDPFVLDRMRDRLAHRGPDDAGSWIQGCTGLATRRLAIIDISPDGHQPMSYGPYTMTFNGEIYNYIELRRELESLGHRFSTQSDTEVLLHAYAQWDVSCLERLNGMFAFAIWDDMREMLFAARDRFGERPFFYTTVGTSFVFASEIKSLREHPRLHLRPNHDAIYRFLAFGQMTAPSESFFADIRRLPGAHYLVYKNGVVTTTRYYALPTDLLSLTFKQATDRFVDLLTDSVRLRMRSDVPIGSSLSGGLDSSAIVSIMASLNPDHHRKSFTARFDGFPLDEGRYVDDVARRSGVESHGVFPTSHELADDLDGLVACQEEPFASSSIYAQWRVMKLAKSCGVTVLLDGQGADELLGGYPAYGMSYLVSSARDDPRGFRHELAMWRAKQSLSASRIFGGLWLGGYPAAAAPAIERVSSWIRRDDLRVIDSGFADAHANMLHPRRYHNLDMFRSALSSTQEVSILPGLLRYADRNSMAHSVEVRLPFLDHRLAEFVTRLPARYKIHCGVSKRILRKAVADIVPESVLARTDKIGFVTPQATWMREGLRDRLAEVYSSRRLRDRGIFAPAIVGQRWREHSLGVADHSSLLWRVAMVELWLETYVDAGSRADHHPMPPRLTPAAA